MHRSKLIFAACAIMAAACTSPASQDTSISDTLTAAAGAGQTLFGHQDDLMYGHEWYIDPEYEAFEASDVYDTCGDYPAVLGLDLGEIELAGEVNIDGNLWPQMLGAARAHHGRGGIVTISWHPRNPLTGGDAWDNSSDRAVASVLEGGERHGAFMEEWLGRAADFIAELGFPVIFRPWHENSGGWFWWGSRTCTPEQYKALWRMTYDYFTAERGLTDLVWVYSPSGSMEEFLATYPGDDCVDLVGTDAYDGFHPGFVERTRRSLTELAEFCAEHGKLLALTECGFEGTPEPDWWTAKLMPAVEGLPVCYALTWRNAWDKPGHFYGPWKGCGSEEDFIKFYNSSKTLFLKDIR